MSDNQGAIAFNAMDVSAHWQESSVPGQYVATGWIPGNLLNEGRASVEAGVWSLHGAKLLPRGHRYDAVSFNVYDPADGDSARGRFVGQLRGVVRPLLEWTVEQVD